MRHTWSISGAQRLVILCWRWVYVHTIEVLLAIVLAQLLVGVVINII